MKLNVLMVMLKPVLPKFKQFLRNVSLPVDEGGYLQPGDSFATLGIYEDNEGIKIAVMRYKIENESITVTGKHDLTDLQSFVEKPQK
jgi:hypothetical protein